MGGHQGAFHINLSFYQPEWLGVQVTLAILFLVMCGICVYYYKRLASAGDPSLPYAVYDTDDEDTPLKRSRASSIGVAQDFVGADQQPLIILDDIKGSRDKEDKWLIQLEPVSEKVSRRAGSQTGRPNASTDGLSDRPDSAMDRVDSDSSAPSSRYYSAQDLPASRASKSARSSGRSGKANKTKSGLRSPSASRSALSSGDESSYRSDDQARFYSDDNFTELEDLPEDSPVSHRSTETIERSFFVPVYHGD